jgi:predicted dehydrogenase
VALRACDVEVAAICGRDRERVRLAAEKLGIPEASIDWRQALARLRPTVVAIATPASLRGEIVEVATAAGIHILTDKPLATTAEEARRLYRLVAAAGVKHAYAATLVYDPSITWLTELVREGAIGQLQQICYELRMDHPPLEAFGWWSMVATGGGPLNNFFAHMLPIFQAVAGGEVVRAVGVAQQTHHRVPVIPWIHDERTRVRADVYPPAEDMAKLEWRQFDAETHFSALLTIRAAHGEVPVSALIAERSAVAWPPNGLRLYGTEGALLADGVATWKISRLRGRNDAPEALPVPQRLLQQLPQVGDEAENKWAALAREFLADIRGEAYKPYLTFRDGWRFQCIIEAIRKGLGWQVVPE